MKNNEVKKAAVKEKKRTIAISTMTSAMKNTAPSPAVALEASRGTTTEADFNVLSSKSTQGANHQHRFKAATTISTSSVHQSYGTSQSVSFALFNVFDTPQSWQSRTLSSPVMKYFMPPLVDPSSCTSNQAQHFRRISHVVLITATQPMLGGTNEQKWHSWMSPYPYEIVEKPREVIKCCSCRYNFPEKYDNLPHNLIIKHVDKRIRGKSDTGQICHSVNFTPAHYHANMLKNYVFDGIAIVSPSLAEEKARKADFI